MFMVNLDSMYGDMRLHDNVDRPSPDILPPLTNPSSSLPL
jgi:hypothetical protein